MEAREIQVIANSQNLTKTIMSTADNLGELKAELRHEGFNVEGMDFKEGKTRTELKDELSALPTNFTYRGELTNSLIIMMTPQNNKIKSGAMTRPEAYAKVKEYNLQAMAVSKFGKNFTQCSTDMLCQLIAEHENNAQVAHQPAAALAPQAPAEHVQPASAQPALATGASVSEATIRTIAKDEATKVVKEHMGGYTVKGIAWAVTKLTTFLRSFTFMGINFVSQANAQNVMDTMKEGYNPSTPEEIAEMEKACR